MAMNFTSAQNASAQHGVKIMTYGLAGMGKTVMCATAPKPVLISAESGLLCLRKKNLERIFGVNNPNICYDMPVIEVANVDDLTQAYNWASRSAEANNFSTICLDSVSEIAEVVLNNAKRQVKDPRQAYGELLEKMQTLIRLFRDLKGKHVFMTSKQEYNKDEVSGITKYGPSMPGSKLGQQVPYFFDEVFRLGINKDQQGNEYRFLQTQPDIQYEAKDRSGSLDKLELPLIYNVINKILGDQ